MATKVEDAINEMQGLLTVFAPQHEGLRDFASLNLTPRTHDEVRQSIINYDRRKALLEAAIVACQNLMTDGHPNLPIREVDPASLADLQANAASIEAALARFASNAADEINLDGGEVVPKR